MSAVGSWAAFSTTPMNDCTAAGITGAGLGAAVETVEASVPT